MNRYYILEWWLDFFLLVPTLLTSNVWPLIWSEHILFNLNYIKSIEKVLKERQMISDALNWSIDIVIFSEMMTANEATLDRNKIFSSYCDHPLSRYLLMVTDGKLAVCLFRTCSGSWMQRKTWPLFIRSFHWSNHNQ